MTTIDFRLHLSFLQPVLSLLTLLSGCCALQKGHSDNQIGCVRVITLDGHQFAEQLEALDDLEHIQ